jgi:hypothetical protein
MEAESLLPCSQESATEPYTEPDESSPQPHTISFKYILIRQWLPSGTFVRFFISLMHATCLGHPILGRDSKQFTHSETGGCTDQKQ